MSVSIYKGLEKDSTKGICWKNNAHGILPALCTSKEPDYGNCRKQAVQIILWGRLGTDTYLEEVILNGACACCFKVFPS